MGGSGASSSLRRARLGFVAVAFAAAAGCAGASPVVQVIGPPPTTTTTAAPLPPAPPPVATTVAPTTTAFTPRSFTAAFTGDVLPHRPVVAAAEAAGRVSGVPYDFRPMFAAIAPIVAAVDLAVCHLEAPITPAGRAPSGFPLFGAPPELVDGLADAGYDRCSTASNHALDQGMPGIDATVDALEQRGLGQSGMARQPVESGPALVTVEGVLVAHISATWSFNGLRLPPDEPWRSNLIDPDRIVAEAAAARSAGAEVVIVSLHWGAEYVSTPTGYQRDLAQRVLGSGLIDLIVGHHAHVLQPIEQVADRWVVFGLGNILSNQGIGNLPAASGDGVIVRVRFTERAEGGFAVERPEAVATWVDRAAGFVVRPVAAALADPALEGVHARLAASQARTEAVIGPFLVVM